MLIKATGVARLTRDVEIKYTNSGNAIANFGVASSEKYKTQTGEQKEKVMFIDCVAFSKLGEICNQYLRKGSKIFIIGKLELQQWTDSNGQKKSKHSLTIESMEMLDSKADSQNNNQSQQNSYQAPQRQQPQGNYQPPMQQQASVPEIDVDNSEIPF